MDGTTQSVSKTGFRIQEEEFTWELYEEVKPLLQKHWEEIADNKDKVQLNPDEGAYFLCQENGALHCLSCREKDTNKLVGYLVTFFINHPHYKEHKFAQNDIFYLDPSYRKGSLGIKLIKEHEKCMKKFGVSIIMYHFKPKKDFSKILERLGHSLFEYTYSKYIGD